MAEALLELQFEDEIVRRDQPLRLPRRLGPDERGAVALERQDGERAGRQEMLFRAPFMRALVGDRRDDARLAVVPVDAS